MKPSGDGLPSVGLAARMLGVRPGEIVVDHEETAMPHTGGMSVAVGSAWNLPHHRRPSGMRRGSTGPASDRVYRLNEPSLAEFRLLARSDPRLPDRHAFVEPESPMLLRAYEVALGATRPRWEVSSS